MFRLLNK